MPAKAASHLRARTCQHCGVAFSDKPSKKRIFCSRACMHEAKRTLPPCVARPCAACGDTFTPKHQGAARYCSKKCIWLATKGSEFNARIASESRHAMRAAQVDKSNNGRTYRKLYGRHEHRVIAERLLGRPLKKGEIVHHKDGDKRNNTPSNLEVMIQSAHMRAHGLGIPGKSLAHEPWKYRRRA